MASEEDCSCQSAHPSPWCGGCPLKRIVFHVLPQPFQHQSGPPWDVSFTAGGQTEPLSRGRASWFLPSRRVISSPPYIWQKPCRKSASTLPERPKESSAGRYFALSRYLAEQSMSILPPVLRFILAWLMWKLGQCCPLLQRQISGVRSPSTRWEGGWKEAGVLSAIPPWAMTAFWPVFAQYGYGFPPF